MKSSLTFIVSVCMLVSNAFIFDNYREFLKKKLWARNQSSEFLIRLNRQIYLAFFL